MGFLLVPLFVSAVFFLAVCFRDLRGDFRERTHQFEDLDPWEGPPPESPLRRRRKGAAPRRHQARDFIRRNLVVVACSASFRLAVLWLVLACPICVRSCSWRVHLIMACLAIGVGLALAALTMMSQLACSAAGHPNGRHWSEPRLTLMVIPFEALGDDPSQRSMANTLNKGLKRELASWNGLDLIPVKTASMAQRQTVDADQRGARPRPRYALEGSVLRSNETVSIQARLFDAQTARDVWSAQLKRDPADHSRILG